MKVTIVPYYTSFEILFIIQWIIHKPRPPLPYVRTFPVPYNIKVTISSKISLPSVRTSFMDDPQEYEIII